MEQRILIDYFAASWKVCGYVDEIEHSQWKPPPEWEKLGKMHDKERFKIFDLIGKPPNEDWEIIKSYYGCTLCYYYEGIKIHIGEDIVILDCSGRGCRTLENEFGWDWETHLKQWQPELTEHQPGDTPRMHIARLDVACDLIDCEEITVAKIQDSVKRNRYTCRSGHYRVIDGSDEEAVYFGSPKSDRRLRIYNKAKEQGITDYQWVRFEFQLRNDNALSFILNYYRMQHFGFTFYGVMADYVNFTQLPVMEIMMKEK